jgi:hypothetical protein
VNTATTYVIARKGAEVLVCPVENFSFGEEETVEQVVEKITAALTGQGYECAVGTAIAQGDLATL